MSAELEALRAKIRTGKQPLARRASAAANWRPLDRDRLSGASRRILAFDQTVNHTGAALLVIERSGRVIVDRTWMVEPKDPRPDTSFTEIYRRLEDIEQGVQWVLRECYGALSAIVAEMPTPRGYRVESSLLAGQEVRRAARSWQPTVPMVMVGNGSMRALLTPPGQRQEKRYVRQALEELIPQEDRQVKYWNEHVHDAVGLGLTVAVQQAAEVREKQAI